MALHKTFYVWFFCWLDPQFYSQTMVLHDSAQSMGSGGGGVRDPYFIEDMFFFQFCFFLTGRYMTYKFGACFFELNT